MDLMGMMGKLKENKKNGRNKETIDSVLVEEKVLMV
jgi:hypothetical protein